MQNTNVEQETITTLSEFLRKFKELETLADSLYREIENWYRNSDNGQVVYNPMNVPIGTVGQSSRPHQNNAFYLAKEVYFKFANIRYNMTSDRMGYGDGDFIQLKKALKSISKGKRRFYSDQQIPQNKKRFSLIPDRFYADFCKFIESFNRMWSNYNALSQDASSYKQCLTELFETQAQRLSEVNEYTHPMFLQACEEAHNLLRKGQPVDLYSQISEYSSEDDNSEDEVQALGSDSMRESDYVNSDEQVGDQGQDLNIDIDDILLLDKKFCYVSQITSWGQVAGEEPVPNLGSEKECITKLARYLAKYLPGHASIDLYSSIIGNYFYSKNLLADSREAGANWKPHQFFTPRQNQHAQVFRNVLNELAPADNTQQMQAPKLEENNHFKMGGN